MFSLAYASIVEATVLSKIFKLVNGVSTTAMCITYP